MHGECALIAILFNSSPLLCLCLQDLTVRSAVPIPSALTWLELAAPPRLAFISIAATVDRLPKGYVPHSFSAAICFRWLCWTHQCIWLFHFTERIRELDKQEQGQRGMYKVISADQQPSPRGAKREVGGQN